MKESPENMAWEIARDPSASEKHWMAACTLLDGKLHPAKRKQHPFYQLAVGLPWSLTVSALSGLGAYTLFALSIGIVNIFSYNLTYNEVIKGPQLFVLLNAFIFGFASVFMYQKHVWNGGRVWSIAYYGLVAVMMYLTASHQIAAYGALSSAVIGIVCTVGFAGLAIAAKRVSSGSIARLESTVGARRVLPHTRAMLVVSGLMLTPALVMPDLQIENTVLPLVIFLWLVTLFSSAGAYVAKMNDAHNAESAAGLAVAAWTPLIYTSLLQYPVMLIGSGLAAFSLIPQVEFFNYVLGTFTLIAFTVPIGLSAAFGAYRVRQTSAKRLQRSALALSLEQSDSFIAPVPSDLDPYRTCDTRFSGNASK